MFKKILIANRGEIACRVAQTLQEMGICAVAVYSDPDRSALHVRSADEAYRLEGQSSAETYLRGDRIIKVANEHGVEAIHPGYGFLSENAAFAQACADAGITFIGPSPAVIRAMGDKVIAKRTMSAAGVPVIPGWSSDAASGGLPPLGELAVRAAEVGYPILVKAAAGGGGKGMRIVEREADLGAAIESAQREAGKAFGDSRVFFERYLTDARHVEIQIFGDSHGNCVHLFERECSIQRRHQKIVEESPSPAVSSELRRQMGEAGVRAAAALGYTNAGTVEFVVDGAGHFYFLEVNTRLQVEHSVTELVTRRDLVQWQLAVASGDPLPARQAELTQTGHAIECRVYAEDAARGFMPSTGRIQRFLPPNGPGIRVDSGVMTGSEVTVHYDPMLAKLIAWAPSRADAIAKMAWALDRFVILGVTTNIPFLSKIVRHPEFAAGRTTTRFLEHHPIGLDPTDAPVEAIIAAAWTAMTPTGRRISGGEAFDESPDPWQTAGAWRAF